MHVELYTYLIHEQFLLQNAFNYNLIDNFIPIL